MNPSIFWISCYRHLLKNMLFVICRVGPLRGSESQAIPFPWLEGSGMRTASEGACSLGPGWQQLPLLCVTVRCGESPVQVVCTTLPTPCHAHFLLLRARALAPSWSLHRKQQGSAMLGSVVQLKRSGFILVAPYYLWHKKGNSWLKQLSRVSERTLSL